MLKLKSKRLKDWQITTMTEFIARPAVEADLVYIDHLQRKNAEELAFYPKIVFEREINNQRIVLAEFNGEPCGYLYHGAFSTVCRVHQACIQYDLRGQLYGATLVRHLIALCEGSQTSAITLRCGSDIAANGFWRAMGFECEAVTQGGVRRMRDINNWRLNLQRELFTFSQEPSTKQKDASIWRKRGEMSISSFRRGHALKEYRKAVIDAAND